ncbi:MAG: TadE family protein [Planctomycetota bacterium]
MRRWHHRASRSGIATIECLICLPVLLTITFGTIELCAAMFLKETLTIAAYEGARVGVQSGGTDAEAISRIEQVLDERGIVYDGSAITFSSPSFNSAATLDMVTVTIEVDCSSNLPITGGNFFTGQSLSASIVMRKEFANP